MAHTPSDDADFKVVSSTFIFDKSFDLINLTKSWALSSGSIVMLIMSYYRDTPCLSTDVRFCSNLTKALDFISDLSKNFHTLQFTSKDPPTFEFFGMEESAIQIVLHGLSLSDSITVDSFVAEKHMEDLHDELD